MKKLRKIKSKGSEKLKKSESLDVSKARKITEEESDNKHIPAYKAKRENYRTWEASPEHRETVRSFTAYGIPQEEIAAHIGISIKSLQRHFSKEIREGLTYAKAKVGEKIYHIAVGYEFEEEEWDPVAKKVIKIKKKVPPNLTALIFFAKTRCGWKETQVVENVNKGDNVRIYLPDNGRDTNLKKDKGNKED